MSPGTLLVLIMLPQNLLYLGKAIFVYQRFMSSFGRDIAQFHPGLTQIEAVMEYVAPL
ncbi:hypothetical protein ACFLTZ_06045 [Chloroflexota bacterium]